MRSPNIPLIEACRPREFTEVIGVQELDKIRSLISNPENMPNLMFYGSAGTGKTSVVKIILNTLKPIDYIKINGSDTTGVDMIRERVYNFVTSKSTVPGKPKMVWIEECDFLSVNAWAALRGIIEQYIINARFIVTLNYLNKIPEPIQSRFTTVEFTKASDEQIFARIRIICDEEKIRVEDDTLKKLIVRGKGDIRTIINNIQHLSANENKIIKEEYLVNINNLEDEVYGLLIDKKWTEIRYEIPKKHPNYNELLVDLEDNFFNSEFPVSIKAKITEIISDSLYEMSFSFDKAICFSACCSKIIKEL